MSKTIGAQLLHKLILRGASGKRMWASLVAMSIGMSLLLVAVLLWWNFDQVLNGKTSDDSLGSTFLTLSRRVTNENMGRPEQTVFSAADIDNLKKAPQVEDVGIVQSLKPQAYMSMQIAPGAGFSTVMILESVPDRFMDKRPAEWAWAAGSTRVPVILSSSFLSLYNYAYAPSQGLPQLSEESIKALPFKLTVSGSAGETNYVAQVAGFSDRITSVLVPEAFINYANGAPQGSEAASRLVVKVKDPSSTAFSDYLTTHGYVTNSEMLRWNKVRAIVQVVALITGLLALLLLGISVLVFILFIELTIARARQSVQLLQEIGYSPKALRSFLTSRFLPMLFVAMGCALVLATLVQVGAHYMGTYTGLHFAMIPGWPMWACLVLVVVLLLLQMRAAIGKAIPRA
jgi:cell division protein FtsX